MSALRLLVDLGRNVQRPDSQIYVTKSFRRPDGFAADLLVRSFLCGWICGSGGQPPSPQPQLRSIGTPLSSSSMAPPTYPQTLMTSRMKRPLCCGSGETHKCKQGSPGSSKVVARWCSLAAYHTC